MIFPCPKPSYTEDTFNKSYKNPTPEINILDKIIYVNSEDPKSGILLYIIYNYIYKINNSVI